MIPFRVFDHTSKEMWVVINYHPGEDAGSYLLAREDEAERDKEMKIVSAKQLVQYRLVDFLEEVDQD